MSNKSKCIDCKKPLTSHHKTLRCNSCSRKHLWKENPHRFTAKMPRGKDHPWYKNGLPKCLDCGVLLKTYTSKRCKTCWGLYERGENNPSYVDGLHAKYNRFCKICNKPISCGSITNRCISCARKEYLQNNPEDNRGSNHPRWRGGVSKVYKLIRDLSKYLDWRKGVFGRDSYTCQICKAKRDLEVHHKIPVKVIISMYDLKTTPELNENKLLWDINWGITLCRSCHGIIGERWITKPLEEK